MGLRGFLTKLGLVLSDTEVLVNGLFCKRQVAPAAMTVAATITAAQLLKGIITADHAFGATQAYTLPTGADLDDSLTSFMINNASFDFTIINVSAAVLDTITLTASVGITIVGQALVESAHVDSEFPSSGTFRCRKTAADTFVVYRIS
jgi:hypothetical protein